MRVRSSISMALSAAVLAAALADLPARADLVETRSLSDRVPVDAGSALRVVVDDVFGFVHVTASDSPVVEMKATESVRGKTQGDLARARAQVGLRTERAPGEVAFLVRRKDGGCDCGWNRWDGYTVKYDIELTVPRNASLDLSTVNEGDIVVAGVGGHFDVSNVNGAVRLTGLAASGHARTVNGRLEASFARAPAGELSFETVNGRIDVAFPDDLSADLAFSTMHGEIWTDFAGKPLPVVPPRRQASDGTAWVIHAGGASQLRVGAGGPAYSFKTLNGDVLVRKSAP